jgi:hypothetical protein
MSSWASFSVPVGVGVGDVSSSVPVGVGVGDVSVSVGAVGVGCAIAIVGSPPTITSTAELINKPIRERFMGTSSEWGELTLYLGSRAANLT